jgi:hypothetical protein
MSERFVGDDRLPWTWQAGRRQLRQVVESGGGGAEEQR